MLKEISMRMKQGYKTIKFPAGTPPKMTEHYCGRPIVNQALCEKDCDACIQICPTGAISKEPRLKLDLGKCVFCSECENICESKAIFFSDDFSMSTSKREDLLVSTEETFKTVTEMRTELKKILGRSLKLRVVSAGGCNACEADVNVLGTIGWDLGRFGIDFVASPRHADGLLITGPVTHNMVLALKKTYDAIPEDKIVIAVGACALSGGLFDLHAETEAGIEGIFPVDLWIPGCPPNPITILDGLLRLTGKIKK